VTTRTRLALGFAAALGLLLAAFSAAIFLAFEHALLESVDRRLHARVDEAEGGLELDERGRPHFAGRDLAQDPALPLTEVVRLRDGAKMYRSDDHEDTDALDRTGAVRRNILDWKSPRTTFLASGLEVRLMALRTSARGEVYEVWMAEPLEWMRAEERELLAALAVALPVALALAILGGRWLAGRAIRPIEDALEATRRFTADASHELRTPLAAIRLECEVALRRPRAVEEQEATLRSVLEEAERLSRLAARLLDLSRADAPGGLPLAREEVPVGALAREVCDRFEPLATEKGLALACAVEGAPAVRGDAVRLRELVQSLVENALRFTTVGRIDVCVRNGGGAVAIEVADTGCGIAPEHVPRIFDRFYRADPARSGGGAGLGLAIAKAVAEAHGGSIGVESTPGRGSRFFVSVPAA
jgi:signal transduction histidine kinase